MGSAPAISIIVPVYNVEAYIGDAIRSLLGQDFGDFEAILVDDGSTDRSLDVVRELVGDDPRFRMVSQENAGPAMARNRGFDEARGTFVLCLDADDYYADGTLARLHGYATAHDLDYLDFTAHTFYEDERLRAVLDEDFYETRADVDGIMTGPELFCAYQRTDDYCCSPCMHFFKRSLIEGPALRMREGMYICEDELFSPLLIARAKRAAFLNEQLYQRRVRASSTMTSGRGLRNVAATFEASQGLYDWMRAHAEEFDGAFRTAVAHRIAWLRDLACHDALGVPAEELVEYSAGLKPADQVDFELAIIEGTIHLEEFYKSRTFRTGEAVLAVPKAVRKLIKGR